MESLAAELYEKVWLLRGTISGEHADGLSRTPFLARQYGPLVNVFRELKQIFDPHGLLNPGKKVPLVPTRMTQNLRLTSIRLPDSEARPAMRSPQPTGRGDRSSCSSAGDRKRWPPRPALATAAAPAARFRSKCECARSST